MLQGLPPHTTEHCLNAEETLKECTFHISSIISRPCFDPNANDNLSVPSNKALGACHFSPVQVQLPSNSPNEAHSQNSWRTLFPR